MNKCEISLKGNLDFQDMAGFLGDIVKSFKDRTVCIQKGGEFVTLKPADVIAFEVEAARKKGKQKLAIELSWAEETVLDAPAGFKISSKEPELTAEAVAEAAAAPACEPAKKAKDAKKPAE
jgi:amphi-Trp domain-containing protein